MGTSRVFKTPKGTELSIMDVKGKEYLEVKYRLVWFREERPDYGIETVAVSLNPTAATFQATIRDEKGRVLAMAHKSEDKQGFPDFMEKAETGAIGRALALIGYGTQFCGEELDEGKRIVDSPTPKRDAPPAVGPEQPGPDDGSTAGPWDGHYRPSRGKYAHKTLLEVYNDPKEGPQGIAGYIRWFAEQEKKGKPSASWVPEFIKEAEAFLGAMENGE